MAETTSVVVEESDSPEARAQAAVRRRRDARRRLMNEVLPRPVQEFLLQLGDWLERGTDELPDDTPAKALAGGAAKRLRAVVANARAFELRGPRKTQGKP